MINGKDEGFKNVFPQIFEEKFEYFLRKNLNSFAEKDFVRLL